MRAARRHHSILLPRRVVPLVALLLATSLAVATQVRPVSLQEMSRRAVTIFSGRCVEVYTEQHPALGRSITVAVFEVDRAIKGQLGSTVTIRLFEGGEPAELLGGVGSVRFREDEEVILFLYGESSLGLTSPVGMTQGKFSIHEDKQGRKVALNGLGNRNFARELSPQVLQSLAAGREDAVVERGVDPNALLDLVNSYLP